MINDIKKAKKLLSARNLGRFFKFLTDLADFIDFSLGILFYENFNGKIRFDSF